MHLALELDQSKQVSADPKSDLDLALTVLRKRIDEFGVDEPLVQKVGDDRIVVELAGITDPARAKAIVQRSAFLEFRITDETRRSRRRCRRWTGRSAAWASRAGRHRPSPRRSSSCSAATRPEGSATAREGQRPSAAPTRPRRHHARGRRRAQRPDPAGRRGGGSDAGRVPGAGDRLPRVDSLLNIPAVARQLPRGRHPALELAAPPASGCSRSASSTPWTTADHHRRNLVDAQAQIDPLTNGPIVTFELDRAGGRKFGDETGRHVGDYMAILLDGRVQGRPPVIQSRIGRNGQITLGGRTLQEAQDLALTLKAGALPIPLKIVEERQVGASLGEDSIRKGITAGLVGTAARDADHGRLLPAERRAGGRGAGALPAVHPGRARRCSDATLTLPGLAGSCSRSASRWTPTC